MHWSEWLHARVGRTDSIALVRLMQLLFEFLASELNLDAKICARTIWADYRRGGRHDRPGFLLDFLPKEEPGDGTPSKRTLPKRQARHLVKGVSARLGHTNIVKT
jgi:hypothetical protein